MALPIIQADLESRLGVGELAKYSRGTGNVPDPAKVAEAIEQAWSTFRSEAGNVWTLESIDALTAETLPGEARLHIVSHACDIVSAGSNRPDIIDKNEEKARLWRIRVSRNEVRCFDGVLTKIGSGSTRTDTVRISAPAESVFDRGNVSQGFSRRDPPI